MGITAYLGPHGANHQEIVGADPLINYGLFERIRRVRKTPVNSTPVQFTGVSGNVDNTLQSGHGWTTFNNAAGSLNYTGDSILGTQCIKLTTDGGGVNGATISSPRHSVNLTGRMIRLWLKFDAASYTNLSSVLVFVGSGASAFTNFANVSIYAQPNSNTPNAEYSKSGEWVPYTLTPASFTGFSGTIDWTAIQDYRVVAKDTAAGAATVLVGGIDFIPNDSTYSTGVVTFTFDDSYLGQFTNARPKLEQYGYKATFYPIFDTIGSSGTFMTQAQIDQLATLGHEIGFHSWTSADHNRTTGFAGMSNAALMNEFGLMKGWMHTKGYKGIEHMAYPQGGFDANLLAIMKQQFAAARLDTYRTIETLPVGDPYRLRSLTIAANGAAVTPNSTIATAEWYCDQIALYGGWLIFYTHDVVASGATGNQTNQASFNALVDYIATKGIPVRTIGDVLEI